MSKLQNLKRPSKWRENVTQDLTTALRAGHPLYGVQKDGKYVEIRRGKTLVKQGRVVKGAVVANRVLAKQH